MSRGPYRWTNVPYVAGRHHFITTNGGRAFSLDSLYLLPDNQARRHAFEPRESVGYSWLLLVSMKGLEPSVLGYQIKSLVHSPLCDMLIRDLLSRSQFSLLTKKFVNYISVVLSITRLKKGYSLVDCCDFLCVCHNKSP